MGSTSGLRHTMGAALQRAWLRHGAAAIALAPISAVYAALVGLRRMCYQIGLFQSQRLPCPVIVVGNVIAGGAGKTPTTLGIVSQLQLRGISAGVVSRGYGRNVDDIRLVHANDDPSDTGDEPLLIARSTGAPVCVGRNRFTAAQALLAAYPHTQVIVCDDGLQHYALYRDLEVCVFDDRGVGNGLMLPAGPLREPWPRKPLAAAGQSAKSTLVLHTGTRPAMEGFVAQRKLASYAIAHDQTRVPLQALQGPVMALAGIAKPEEFFEALKNAGLPLARTMSLPDHVDFSDLDTAPLAGYQVLCTEKDAVKLWKVWPQALAVPLIQTPEPAFEDALAEWLSIRLPAKLSSPHGHQTT